MSHPAVLFVFSYAVAVVLYAPTLKAFLIWDDIAIIPIISPAGITGWFNSIAPIDNGFIRPATLLSFKLCYTLSGTAPLLYHLCAIAIHSGVSVLTGMLAARVVPGRSWMALLGCIMMTTHFGGSPIAWYLSNSCDGIAALGIVFTVLQWDRWLFEREKTSIWKVWAGFALALSGKELAVVTPAVLLFWTVGRSVLNVRSIRLLLWLGIAAGSYLAVNLWLQVTAKISYVNLGEVKVSGDGMLARLLNYMANSYLPYLSVLSWPVEDMSTSGVAMRIIRRLAAGLLICAFIGSIIRTRYRMPAAMVLCGIVVLLPIAPLSGAQAPRFIYSALPFTTLAILAYVALLRRSILSACVLLLLELWLSYAWSIRWSPSTTQYLRTARIWQKFVKEVGRESASWPPGSTITVYTNFAHSGRKHIPTNYGLVLFRVFYPNLLADYVSNKVLSRTTHRYSFDGHKLTPVVDDSTSASKAEDR